MAIKVTVKGYLNGWAGMDDANPPEWGGEWALAPLLSGELVRSNGRKLVLVDDASGMKAVVKGHFGFDAAGEVARGTIQKISYSYHGIGAIQTWGGLKWKVAEVNALLDKADNDHKGAFFDFLRDQSWTYRFAAGGSTAVGSDHADRFVGGRGDDTAHGLGGADRMFGKGGDDDLFGGNGADRLYGHAGADELYGGGGRDIVKGGGGDDVVDGGAGDDRLWGDAGDDLLLAGAGDDTLRGGDGDDEMHADSGENTFWGGDGDDFIQGGNGVDEIHGGEGDDEIISSGVDNAGGDDTVYGDGGADHIRTNEAVATDDVVDGGDGDDRLDAYGGRDTLDGGAGNDTLNGGDGRDSLHGGSGDDWLYGDGQGGAERDVFILTGADEGRDMSDLDIELTQVSGDTFYLGDGAYDGVWTATMTDAIMISSGSTAEAVFADSFDDIGMLALQIQVKDADGAVTARLETYVTDVPFGVEDYAVVRDVVEAAVQDALDLNILYDDTAFL